MKKFNVVLLFIIVLASCSPSEGAIQTAISRTQTALPTVTVTPSKTSEPSQTPTEFPPTPTKTEIPTLTPTFTALPPDIILLQEDFEDNNTDGWYSWTDGMTKRKGPNWIVEQEPDGNHYASASGLTTPPNIWYGDKNLSWTDYAFESRIQFVMGSRLGICVYADGGRGQNVVDMHDIGQFDFVQWNEMAGFTQLGTENLSAFVRDTWYTIRLEITGDLFSMFVNNSLVRTQKMPTPLINTHGGVGYQLVGEKFYIDDIKVWSLK